MSWRLRHLLEEVWANQRLVSLLLLAFAGVGLGAAGLVEHGEVADILARERALERKGAYVYVAESSFGGIDARRCADLERASSVRAAGALRSVPTLTVATDPGGELRAQEVTRGIVEVWDPDYAGTLAAFGVTRSAADDLGLAPGSWTLPVGGRPVAVDFVADVSVRAAHLGDAALVLVPPLGRAGQCWVSFEPGAPGAAALVRATLGGPGTDVAVRPLAVRDEDFVPPLPEALVGRGSRRGWLVAGLGLGLASAIAGWGRRHDMAVYRALGMSRATALAYHAFEALLLAVAGASLGVALLAVAVAVTGGPAAGPDGGLAAGGLAAGGLPARLAVRTVLLAACVWWAAAVLTGVLSALPNRVLATLKGD